MGDLVELVSSTHVHDLGEGPIPRGTKFRCSEEAATQKLESGTAVRYEEPQGEGQEEASGDGADRVTSIVDAILGLESPDDNPAAYTADGLPKIGPLTAAVGFDVSAKERDEAWALVQE